MRKIHLFVTACLPILTLLIAGCGGGGGSASVAQPRSGGLPPASELMLAVPNSAYGNVLIDCALAETRSSACRLETLPLIGTATDNPTVNDIMARTVVSHWWMSLRFRDALDVMPNDLLQLMKSVTGIVIASDIRPSYYSAATGTIYMDPAHIWLDNVEKATISKEADFRSNFGDDLPLVSLARYITGNQYAWMFFSLNDTRTRTVADIEKPVAALLFHELAHANDAVPPSEISALDQTLSVWAAAESLLDRQISKQLDDHLPLNSQLMTDLAEVLYIGAQPTSAQLALTAEQVGLEFENDGASDDYGYSSRAEDLAMLFEEIMMHHHYAVDRQITYTDTPTNDGRFCSDFIVRWGFLNRIGDPLVKSRAEFGLQLLLNTSDVSNYIDNLPAPRRMTNGLTWCDFQNPAYLSRPLSIKDAHTLRANDTPGTLLRPDDLYVPH
jgi:hypothetical protein